MADELANNLADTLLRRTGAPGVAVAYFRHGEQGVAVAGVRAAGSDVVIEPNDLWHIGSNTKSMTALLVARLAEAGEIDWDDTVGEVLATAVPGMNDAYQEVTYRDLMAHRSGLAPNIDVAGQLALIDSAGGRDLMVDRLRYARSVLEPAPQHAPGSDYLYSNAGYIVAGAMMEAATGIVWEDLMTREVFGPLGLSSAGFGPPGVVGELTQPRGHQGALSGTVSPMEPDERADNIPAMGPAGTAHMNASDLLRYLVAHLEEDPAYLSQETWDELHMPADGQDYVAGWVVSPNGVLFHAGSNTFWYVLVAIWPDRDEALVLAANAGDIAVIDPEFGEVARLFVESR